MIWLVLHANFFNAKAQGWHFYQDHHVAAEKENPAPKTLKELKAHVQQFLEEAIWHPTPQNVLRYQRIQKMVMDKSEKFAQVWQKVLLDHPDLDNTLQAPSSYYGSLHSRKMKQIQHQLVLKENGQKYGLVLLTNGDSHGNALGKVAKNLAKDRGYAFMILDGREVMRQWGVKRLPVLILVNLSSSQKHIITYSLIGADEIEERMVKVMS